MDPKDGRRLVSSFNDCINAQDLAGLSALMTDDHVFIDKADNRVVGKSACQEAWRGFFGAFPDYRNNFEDIQVHDNLVVVAGRSTCSDPRLAGAALWTAKVRDGRISEWRVWEDTKGNRASLGLPA